jgi:membrane protease YdiL (CAAX protease family)
MTTIRAFIKRHPVLTYTALTFALSWGGVLMIAGPGGISAHSPPPERLVPLLYPAMLIGPGAAGLLLTGLVNGRNGLRELGSRLTRWRVDVRWYAVALLIAPLLMAAVLFTLSRTSPEFLPHIFTADDKAALMLTALVAGLMVGIFEELGWTGFAVPALRQRHGVVATGLIVGFLWGAWHFPLFFWGSAASSGTLPLILFLPGLLFSWLPAFRTLMVWVYDRTGSLLVTILMHVSLVTSMLILVPQTLTGATLLTYDLTLAAALWAVVAAVAVVNRGHRSRRPLRSLAA